MTQISTYLRKAWLLRWIWLGLVFPIPLAAQAGSAEAERGGTGEGELVRNVTFPGATALSEDALREVIATQETRCRGILLTPFCWFADWDVIAERNRLSTDELPRDELRLLVHYFRQGFRGASVTSETVPQGDGVDVRFPLEEGPVTRLDTVEVIQEPAVLSSSDLERVGVPEEGDPLSLYRLDAALQAVVSELRERGFLDTTVSDSVEVDGTRARLVLRIGPGARATVSGFEIQGNAEIEDRTIIQALYLEEEDVITTLLLDESRRALHQSNLFHEADVTVPEQADSAKVVLVRVREAPARLARLGGGLSTLEFGQLEARFTHYNWRGSGRRLDLRVGVGNLAAKQLTDRFIFHDILPGELAGARQSYFEQPTWRVTADFYQPAFRAVEHSLGLGVFAQRQVIPGVSVDRGFGGEATFTRRLAFRSFVSLTYRHERIAVEAGEVYFCVNFGICELSAIESLRGHNALSPLSLSFLIDRSDDPLGPTSGYRVRVEGEHASGVTLSDFRHNRLSGEATYYLPFGLESRHVVAGRLRAGWSESLSGTIDALGLGEGTLALLHPRKRFFAGGSRSVRGFSENQLGPRILTIAREKILGEDRCTEAEISNRTCDPSLAPVGDFVPRALGGTSVVEGSVEYRVPVGSALLAAFVDAALVGGRGFLRDATGSITPGIGARFSSPAGPIRIDLGLRPRLVEDLRVVTEDELGAANGVVDRELIELDQRRRFDPLEGAGTIGRWLGRLTLHFSIGEAF